MSEAPIIEVRDLTKRFGSVLALDRVSFQLGRGEILGLLGPNGAGKTTTIQLLLGLTIPTTGTARIFGLDIEKHRVEVLRRVNFSSAYIALPSNLTVWENLYVFARLYGVPNPRSKILSLLDLFEIPQVLNRITGALSSGQMTRLNLCKSFLNDPEILFLDEPTASLDPDIADKVRTVLQRVQRERRVTMVYTSHNMQEVELMCDRVIFLSRGRVVAEGTTSEVLERTQRDSLEAVFISLARDGGLRDLADAGEQ